MIASGKSEIAERAVSVRVPPTSYYAAIFFLLFAAAFLFYLESEVWAFAILFLAVFVFPLLAFFDRVRFDGRRLRRTGLIPRLASRFAGIPDRLRIKHIEQVETHAVRLFRRSGRVIYSYRTTIRGRGRTMTFSSGRDSYMHMVKSLFPRLSEDVLDTRSIELRDYYNDRRTVTRSARRSNIPPADVLESSLDQVRSGKGLLRLSPELAGSGDTENEERVAALRRLANELRVTGALRQSAEAFRRAVLIRPADGWLLYEFARCLHSLAGSERDSRMERRAVAMLRLAEKRADGDAKLMTRVGESYFQIGDWRRAGDNFKRTIDTFGESFRALRGLAELALREGKIAHVIHNFAAANRLAASDALKRWTRAEMDYFSRLNDDEEYMELEISRVNLVDRLARWRAGALRFTAFGMPVIVTGVLLQDATVAQFGWAFSGISIVTWAVLSVLERMLAARIPLDLVEKQ